jgi:hypothetical protein
LHQCIRPLIGALAPGRHGYQRACELISGKASTGYLGHQGSHAPGRPNLHLISSRALTEDHVGPQIGLAKPSSFRAVPGVWIASPSSLPSTSVRVWSARTGHLGRRHLSPRGAGPLCGRCARAPARCDVVDQQRAGLNEHSSKQFFAAHNSENGTKRTSQRGQPMSASGRKANIPSTNLD